MKPKIVIITNVPSPYRVDFFYYLQTHCKEYTIYVIYSSVNEKCGRQWHTDENRILNAVYLKSHVVTIHKRYDDKIIILPYGVGKTLDQLNPDVVVAMEYNPTVLQAMRWCLKNDIPYISWTDGTAHSERSINYLQRKFRKYIVRHAAAFIGSSTAARENQISYGAKPAKCYVSFLTVDIEKYLIRPKEKEEVHKKLLYVGSLIQRKGLDLLFEALQHTNDEITLTIVGDGAEKDNLRQKAESLGIESRIVWEGFLEGEKLKNCYRSHDVFILPTREDCFGLVILEAMCAGLPVITSKWADGARDLVEEGVNGIIIDPYDCEETARHINQIFEKQENIERMRNKSYEKANDFSFANVSKGYLDAIKSVREKE